MASEREWSLLVCEVCGEAVVATEFGEEKELWCNGSYTEKHKDTKMGPVMVREIPTSARPSAPPGPASARPASRPVRAAAGAGQR